MNLIKLIVLMLTLSWVLIANSSTEQDEFKIVLPPEPDPILNATTIHGIDVNKNGVRDDIEIYIYKNITKDWNLYNAYLQSYKNEHEIVREINNPTKFEYLSGESDWKAINCIGYFEPNIKISAKQMLNIFYNTDARKKIKREISMKMKSFERAPRNHKEKIIDCNFKVKK